MFTFSTLKLQTIILAATAFTAPAMAAETGPSRTDASSAVVRYADLDLKTDSGVSELQHRIARAADKVCGPVDARSLAEIGLRDACRAKAIEAATPRLDSVVAMARSSSRYAMNQGQDKGQDKGMSDRAW
jgi:UrcA family protein